MKRARLHGSDLVSGFWYEPRRVNGQRIRGLFRRIALWSRRGGNIPAADYVASNMAGERQKQDLKRLGELFAPGAPRPSPPRFCVAGPSFFCWEKHPPPGVFPPALTPPPRIG